MIGDTVFVCFDVISNHTISDHYAWVTHYQLEVASKWGMYRECNGYPPYCIGAVEANVGRESASAMGYLRGQCDPNEEYGSWYSLPAAGLCNASSPINLEANCSWHLLQAVKTIDANCLLVQQDMLKACLQFQQTGDPAPAAAVFRAAFASDDPTQGGCPPIPTAGPAAALPRTTALAFQPQRRTKPGLAAVFQRRP